MVDSMKQEQFRRLVRRWLRSRALYVMLWSFGCIAAMNLIIPMAPFDGNEVQLVGGGFGLGMLLPDLFGALLPVKGKE